MKKLVALMLTIALAAGVAACGGAGNTETAKNDTEGKSAQNILQDVWAAHTDEEKFPAFGGDMENMAENDAGIINVEDGAYIDNMLGFPEESVGLIDEGASLMHMMNQNIFTGAAYHVTDAADVEDVAAKLKDNILNRQWMCGFPDTLIVYRVGENFLISAFGNAEIIDTFETHLTETYGSAELLHEENLAF